MKNLLYYFYLLCFLILIGTGAFSLITGGDEFIGIVLLQLIWGPISALHCLYKFVTTRGEEGPINNLTAISFTITILYFVGLFLVVNVFNTHLGLDEEFTGLLMLIGVPWTMLAFFTYILHKETNLERTITKHLEDDLIQ